MTIRSTTLATIGFLIVAAAPAGAQSLQTGEIKGVVRSSDKNPLAGAKVRAKSGQIERTVVTGPDGAYRLPLLNVGAWTLSIFKEGFRDSSVSVHVSINETKVANFSLVGEAHATVVVVDALGQLDTSTAQVATNLSAKQLEVIPVNMTSMNALDGLMAVVPGVMVSSSGTYQIRGGASNENVFVVDGNITNPTFTNQATTTVKEPSVQPAREFLESVEVVTNSFGAEYGVFGGAINALTKSGTNNQEGSIFYRTNFPNSSAMPFYQADWVPTNPRTPQEDKYHRYGFTVSGPIVKDKLFYFVGFQGFRDVVPAAVFETGGSNWDGLQSDKQRVTGPNQWTAKVNWYLSTDQQLILSATRSHFRSYSGHQWATYGTLDMGSVTDATTQNVNLTWNWTPASNLFVVASVGNFKSPRRDMPTTGVANPVIYSDARYFVDGPGSHGTLPENPTLIGYVTGSGRMGGEFSDNPNTQYKIDVSWLLGANQIRAGYLRQDTQYLNTIGGTTRWFVKNAVESGSDADTLTAIRSDPSDTKYSGIIQGFYLKDVLEIRPGLLLDMGIRTDSYVYKGEMAPFAGMHLAEYDHLSKQLQPRVGIVWDIDQDGRKKVYAHYGRSFVIMPMSIVSWATTSGLYLDFYNAGTWAYNPTYANGTPITLLSGTPSSSIAVGGDGMPLPHATDLRLPRKNTLTLGADWTLPKGWLVGGSWTYWELKDVLEDSYFLNSDSTSPFLETSNTKVTWNPGPGSVTFLDSYGTQHTWASNFPTPKDRYIDATFYATNRGERYDIGLSYTWTHHYGNYAGENTATGYSTTGNTSEFDYAQAIANGTIESDPVHMLKFNGSYRFTIRSQDLFVGMTGVWRTGTGLTSTINAGGKWMATADDYSFGGLYYDTIPYTNRRGDLGRTPNVFNMDLNLGIPIKIRNRTLRIEASVANVFNSRTRTAYGTGPFVGSSREELRANPNFLLASEALSGRTVTAGCSLVF